MYICFMTLFRPWGPHGSPGSGLADIVSRGLWNAILQSPRLCCGLWVSVSRQTQSIDKTLKNSQCKQSSRSCSDKGKKARSVVYTK